MNDQTCACCNSSMRPAGTNNGFSAWRCESCDYEHFSRGDGTIVPQMYEEDPDYNADLSVAGRYSDLIQWAHRETLKWLCATAQGARVLDIGCFNGFFVAALRHGGFDATGIDFNKRAIAHGKQTYGLGDAIGTQTIEELIARGERYDVITMFEVIEHLEEPAAVIDAAKTLLKPGGLFVVSTPNSKMSWRPPLDNPPHHLSRFSPVSLHCLLESRGLNCERQLEQASCFDLARNLLGSRLRNRARHSMRGGTFRAAPAVDTARRVANRVNPILKAGLWPVDRALHAAGFRYISQLAFARALAADAAR